MSDVLLQLNDVTVSFPGRRWRGSTWRRPDPVVAVDAVSLSVRRGEIFGLVGESGCGKSTLARCIVGIYRPKGEILIDGLPISQRPSPAERRRVQLVFQDPFAALNPALRIGDMLSELLLAHGLAHRDSVEGRVRQLLSDVGLEAQIAQANPSSLSGGQRQRVNIARALALEPEILIADEIVSALDASVQASVLNLLLDLRDRFSLTIVFISHNLAVVRQVCDTVAVMRGGQIVENGPADEVFLRPGHPYTQELLDAVPRLRSATRIKGES